MALDCALMAIDCFELRIGAAMIAQSHDDMRDVRVSKRYRNSAREFLLSDFCKLILFELNARA